MRTTIGVPSGGETVYDFKASPKSSSTVNPLQEPHYSSGLTNGIMGFPSKIRSLNSFAKLKRITM
jgi:hypothetical protein